MIGEVISHFEVQDKLGGGGMGVVYRARDVNLDRTVALKFLPPHLSNDAEAKARFVREAQAASSLDHNNICTVYEIGETETPDGLQLFIAMAYYEGRTLGDLINEKSLERSAAISYVRQVLEGLERAHATGIVHRDVKPGNVVVTIDGVAKIIDFGLAKLAGKSQLTVTGSALGTTGYMAPEQIRGEESDARTDIWAVGVMLYEMLVFERPFKGEYPQAVMYAVLNEDPPSLAALRDDIPGEIVLAVERALCKSPDDRFGTAGEFLQALGITDGVYPAPPTAETRVQTGGPSSSSLSEATQIERRLVSMLVSEVFAESTDGSEVDPERVHELLPEYGQVFRDVVGGYEGRIGTATTDRLVATFGYPRAHEDDAVRAVRSAIDVASAIEERNRGLSDVQVRVRSAVHTGMAVTGTDDQLSTLGVVGDVHKIATRLSGLAESDDPLITRDTYELVKPFVDCHLLGERRVRGIARPVTAYRVDRSTEVRSRTDAGRLRGESIYVGRSEEVGLLEDRWRKACDGNGQVVLLSGEAGIGKSRLAAVIKDKVIGDVGSTSVLEFSCSALHQNTALYAVTEVLRRALSAEAFANEQTDEARLAALLGELGLPAKPYVPLFGELLGMATPAYPPLDESPQEKRLLTLSALLQMLLGMSEENPLLLIVEDVHWADPTTRELLGHVVEQTATSRLLLLLTFRPEFEPPWPSHSYTSRLSLARMSSEESARLISAIAKETSLPEPLVAEIIRRTDGVPLFVEELTKTLLETHAPGLAGDGEHALSEIVIPATLQESLMARLDRLGQAKAIAQVGAAIGRDFSFDLLKLVTLETTDHLRGGLRALVDSEILYQKGLPPLSTYRFKHALLRDAAYESLLRRTRRKYHDNIGDILVEHFPARAEQEPEVVAHHFSAAERIDKAVPYWLTAGQQAAARSAAVEALVHFRHGLEGVPSIPDADARQRTELSVLASMGPVLMATEGYASPDVEATYNRARELCESIGQSPENFGAVWGIWALSLVRSRLATALEQAQYLLGLAELIGLPELALEAYMALGITHYWRGEWEQARSALTKSLVLYDFEHHHQHGLVYGQDPGIACHSHMALACWMLGETDAAAAHSKQALALADRGTHKYSLAYAYAFAANYHQLNGDLEQTLTLANDAVALSEKHHFYVWLADGLMFSGWATGRLGDPEAGASTIRAGIEAYRMTGAVLWRTQYLALLAETLAATGALDGSQEALDDAFQTLAETNEVYYEPELHRLRGVNESLAGGAPERVVELFETAVAAANKASSRSLAIRARVELCRYTRGALDDDTATRRADESLAEELKWFSDRLPTADVVLGWQHLGMQPTDAT